jgi:hypothetical protein
MSDNVVKMSKKTGKIPTSVLDKMKEEYDEYVIIALTKDGEMAYSINSESHGNVFQMLLIAGGHVYKDQFAG